MRRKLILGLVAAGLSLPLVGCKTCGPRPNPAPVSCGPAVPYGQPGPYVPGGGPPPSQLPKGPPPEYLPDQPPPPAPIGSQSKSIDVYEYQKNLTWQPGQGPSISGQGPSVWGQGPSAAGQGPSVRLYPPEVDESTDGGKRVQLYPPDGAKDAAPKVEESAGLPTGIAQFVQVRDKVANGLRPSLDDGLEWLQNHGFKTVLFLHEPGASESADRKQVEKRGMKFVTLEVSPATLSQKIVDDFNRIVGDSAGLPLFVYDRDGSLAGGLWYLHFRTILQASEAAAKTQAIPLGLRADGDMWQAAQKYMSEQNY